MKDFYADLFTTENRFEPDMPTIARVMPMKIERWNGFSVTNASPNEGELTYIKLNRQTPCPPRGAACRALAVLRRLIPVNQGCCRRSFTHNTRIAFSHGGDHPSYVAIFYRVDRQTAIFLHPGHYPLGLSPKTSRSTELETRLPRLCENCIQQI
jgi:hypothetical protein